MVGSSVKQVVPMSLASVMVHVDRGRSAPARIALSQAVAALFDARLIGVAAADAAIPALGDYTILDERMIERAELKAAMMIEEVEAVFRKAVRAGRDVEWRSSLSGASAFTIEQSRCADLVVVGRDEKGPHADPLLAARVGDLLMGLGRPLLVVPPGLDHFSPDRVLIAWKNTQEARRAVRDSLPFLKKAGEVMITVVGRDAADEGAEDVADNLRRHGVKARTHAVKAPQIGAADEILMTANGYSVDLIVAGAYGHSRLREWVFGGVTRSLLQKAPVPCLLTR